MWLPNYPEVILPLSISEVKKAHSFSRNSSHVLRDEFGWVSRNSLWMFHFVILWPCGLRINRQDTGSLNTISSTQVHKSLRTSESKMMKEKWLSRYWESAVHLRKYTGEYEIHVPGIRCSLCGIFRWGFAFNLYAWEIMKMLKGILLPVGRWLRFGRGQFLKYHTILTKSRGLLSWVQCICIAKYFQNGHKNKETLISVNGTITGHNDLFLIKGVKLRVFRK